MIGYGRGAIGIEVEAAYAKCSRWITASCSCSCPLSSSYSTFTYIFLIRIIGPGQCVVWQFAQLITSAL